MHRFIVFVSWLFGLLLVGLSLFVTLETVMRKIFGASLQGADELGGYVLAVSGALAFTIALSERAHIRIDLLYTRFSPTVQAALSWLASLSLALFGLFVARYIWLVIHDTLTYNSTAPTAWSTPLIYPQAIWYGAMLIFTLASLWMFGRASRLFFTGQFDRLNAEFHPKTAQEELAEELSDMERR
ncbi:TRAP transporter small permease subunit [Paracoccus methylarcula]|uniref:TRAP transporter small permease protein n=1 Tax=Paracoccus methylarcula TaxID=72022 RepID=A0A3R7LJV7_9RHOB|nr:TRAP transporter small permease [Paracoccus methylarcula]RNF34353.1 TRAP transporter small permease [Paracoccus methylarcula]